MMFLFPGTMLQSLYLPSSYPSLPLLQDNTSNMMKALSATNFGQWKGEVCGETNLVMLK